MLNDLLRMLKVHAYPALPLALALALAAAGVEKNGLRSMLRSLRWKKLLFFFYVAFLLMAAALGRNANVKNPLSNLFDNFWPIGRQEIENILIFVPVSFLFLFAYASRRKLRAAVLSALAVSLFIELSQLISWLGVFQFSDLLFNTLGGALGGALYCGVAEGWTFLRKKRGRR